MKKDYIGENFGKSDTDNNKGLCVPVYKNCTKNQKKGCIRAKHCIWMGTQCNERFNCSQYNGNESICIHLCIYNDWSDICTEFYHDWTLYNNEQMCLANYKCIWSFLVLGSHCYDMDQNCQNMSENSCKGYSRLSNACFWATNVSTEKCMPIFRNCRKKTKKKDASEPKNVFGVVQFVIKYPVLEKNVVKVLMM